MFRYIAGLAVSQIILLIPHFFVKFSLFSVGIFLSVHCYRACENLNSGHVRPCSVSKCLWLRAKIFPITRVQPDWWDCFAWSISANLNTRNIVVFFAAYVDRLACYTAVFSGEGRCVTTLKRLCSRLWIGPLPFFKGSLTWENKAIFSSHSFTLRQRRNSTINSDREHNLKPFKDRHLLHGRAVIWRYVWCLNWLPGLSA